MIHAPKFKDETKYLTSEGWGLGEPCWYCYVDHGGYLFYACALTIDEAQSRAKQLVEAIDAGKSYQELKMLMHSWRPA